MAGLSSKPVCSNETIGAAVDKANQSISLAMELDQISAEVQNMPPCRATLEAHDKFLCDTKKFRLLAGAEDLAQRANQLFGEAEDLLKNCRPPEKNE